MNNNLEKKRHSLAHLLAAAILDMYPDTLLTIGPAIENGFYYDFEFSSSISDKDLPKIEKQMRKLLPTFKEFSHKEVSEKEAKEFFKDNPYKLELIDEIVSKGEKITLYTCGEFTDLCRGGHLENPAREITPDSFKLERLAGAYWRGDEKNKMLSRIYGLAFDTKEELENFEKQREEAKERNHRKLGKELDLFTFSELVGAGLPLWTPKGTMLRDILDSYVWRLRQKVGYKRVDIPHITKKDLYEKSGHWNKFGDELFKVKTREGHEFAMKPMNCPHHIEIFRRKSWSYRELPERYATTTKVYRDEQSGELSGLSRVRCITQDDAHVFCRFNQIKDEMSKIWDIIHEFYGSFGFKLTPRLSMHDPEKMDNYLGEESTWQKAENILREIIKEKNTEATEAKGEAAFYGPKIDFLGKDSLGREWQVATIQLDMNLPERFELDCTNEKGEKERLTMIHAAIMGSIERFLSVFIEHFGGKFPMWLSPVQIKILPISEKQNEWAEKIQQALTEQYFRAELDKSSETLGKKVRNTKLEKVPYWIVIGEKELSEEKIKLESRDKGDLGVLTLPELLEKMKEEYNIKDFD